MKIRQCVQVILQSSPYAAARVRNWTIWKMAMNCWRGCFFLAALFYTKVIVPNKISKCNEKVMIFIVHRLHSGGPLWVFQTKELSFQIIFWFMIGSFYVILKNEIYQINDNLSDWNLFDINRHNLLQLINLNDFINIL